MLTQDTHFNQVLSVSEIFMVYMYAIECLYSYQFSSRWIVDPMAGIVNSTAYQNKTSAKFPSSNFFFFTGSQTSFQQKFCAGRGSRIFNSSLWIPAHI